MRNDAMQLAEVTTYRALIKTPPHLVVRSAGTVTFKTAASHGNSSTDISGLSEI